MLGKEIKGWYILCKLVCIALVGKVSVTVGSCLMKMADKCVNKGEALYNECVNLSDEES